jgi:hypothetical protein
MFNTTTLMWGMLFGIVGFAFFVYGKKQAALVPLICGLALMIFPYFVANIYTLVIVGIVLIALPFFIQL